MGCNLPDHSFDYRGKNRPSRRTLAKIMGLGVIGWIFDGNWAGNIWATEKSTASETSNPVQLHILVEVKAGKGPELEKLFHTAYISAIKVQDGFLWARLLREYESKSNYEIDISFKSEKLRAAWAESKEHQTAWPKIEEIAAKISWKGYDQLA